MYATIITYKVVYITQKTKANKQKNPMTNSNKLLYLRYDLC